MFAVTPDALQVLNELLQERSADGEGEPCFRLEADDEGKVGIRIDEPNTDDTIFYHRGQTVLAVHWSLLQLFAEYTLDVERGTFLLR